MAEAQVGPPADEVVPYDLIIAELETALHRATSETVMLRARLAARDRQAAAPPTWTAPAAAVEPDPEVSP